MDGGIHGKGDVMKNNIAEYADINFTNYPVKVIFVRDFPEITLARKKIGPFKEGSETELIYWIAEKLVDLGFVKFKEEEFNLSVLSKVHWRETLPGSRQLSKLDKNFYCQLRKFLKKLSKEKSKEAKKIREYEKALILSKDLVDCRVRKIVSFAAASVTPKELLEKFSIEEEQLYEKVRNIIFEWKKDVLGDEET